MSRLTRRRRLSRAAGTAKARSHTPALPPRRLRLWPGAGALKPNRVGPSSRARKPKLVCYFNHRDPRQFRKDHRRHHRAATAGGLQQAGGSDGGGFDGGGRPVSRGRHHAARGRGALTAGCTSNCVPFFWIWVQMHVTDAGMRFAVLLVVWTCGSIGKGSGSMSSLASAPSAASAAVPITPFLIACDSRKRGNWMFPTGEESSAFAGGCHPASADLIKRMRGGAGYKATRGRLPFGASLDRPAHNGHDRDAHGPNRVGRPPGRRAARGKRLETALVSQWYVLLFS